MTELTLETARKIIAAVLKKGHEMKFKPLAVAVLDAGGHLKAFEREEKTSTLRPQIAQGKASAALGLGLGTRVIDKMARERPHFAAALNGLAGGNFVPVAGGVLVRDKDGNVIGAVGVTGDVSDNDEVCAVAGIEAAGLVADAGA